MEAHTESKWTEPRQNIGKGNMGNPRTVVLWYRNHKGQRKSLLAYCEGVQIYHRNPDPEGNTQYEQLTRDELLNLVEHNA